jgi:hypothetical protein
VELLRAFTLPATCSQAFAHTIVLFCHLCVQGLIASSLLSVVAPALLIDLLCVDDPSLSSSDANGSYQWEVHTSEGWTLY